MSDKSVVETETTPASDNAMPQSSTVVKKKSNKALIIILVIIFLCICMSAIIAIIAALIPTLGFATIFRDIGTNLPFQEHGAVTDNNNTNDTSNTGSDNSNPNNSSSNDDQENFNALGSATLPSNFPNDIPLYPHAKAYLTYSQDTGSVVSMAVIANSSDVKDFYQNELTSSGWDIVANADYGTVTSFSASKDDRMLYVSLSHDDGSDLQRITLTYDLP